VHLVQVYFYLKASFLKDKYTYQFEILLLLQHDLSLSLSLSIHSNRQARGQPATRSTTASSYLEGVTST